jgi:sulfur-oxidizing protein SoxA
MRAQGNWREVKVKRTSIGLFAVAVLTLTVTAENRLQAQERKLVAGPQDSALKVLKSGYHFLKRETQAMQDDDFDNPGMLWTRNGEELWSKAEGQAGKSCASCHGQAEVTMPGIGASYPKYHQPSEKLLNLEQRINLCRTRNMQAPAWKWESNELLSMTTYVRHQSRGRPVAVEIDNMARPFFEKGKAFFYRRRGLLNMSCAHCHEENYGRHLRANWLSQGQTNGFPAYRLILSTVASVQRWFQICTWRVRSTPHDYGADEYVNLELFMAWRGSGLPIETPAVRY